MATVYVSIGKAGLASAAGAMPVFSGAVSSETIASSGTAAAGSLTASGFGFVAQVYCDTAVYASTDGTASASNGLYVPGGQVAFIAVAPGNSVSVIDV